MPLDEYLEIGGQVWEHLPPGASVQFKPLYSSSLVEHLNGRVGLYRSPLGGHEVTIEPGENYVVPLAVKLALEAAHAGGTPVHLVETYQDPGVRQVWPACLLTRAEFAEAPGTDRELFTYRLTLLTGV